MALPETEPLRIARWCRSGSRRATTAAAAAEVQPTYAIQNPEEDRRLGKRGEDAVYNAELHRVTALGKSPGLVTWVSQTNETAPYDVRSVDADDQVIYFEVKSAKGSDPSEPFFISHRELVEAAYRGDRYYVYRVTNVDAPVPDIVRAANPLPRAEPELAQRLRQVFADDGVTVVEEHAARVESTDGGVAVITASGRRIAGDRLLVADGRRARTDGLDVSAAGIEVDERGFVVVDAQQRTTNHRVWAAGDVTGAPQYVYIAAAAGRVVAAEVDCTGMPPVMFTCPQLASAGIAETEARARDYRCESRVLDLADGPRALVNRETRGAIKLLADAETGKVLGVHALADRAGEIMLAATYAIKAGMTVDELANTWAPYLTMAEWYWG